MHILLIDDIFPINTRNSKILSSLASHYKDGVKLSVITWNRNNADTTGFDNYYFYEKVSAYGKKLRKLVNLWGYRRFCHSTIKMLSPDVVIASHWNNLLLVPRLCRQKQMLIYENLDVPTGPEPIRKVVARLEKMKMKDANLTIHASRFFCSLYDSSLPQIVLENKPTFEAVPSEYKMHTPIRVAFIGLIRHLDILKNLISAIRSDTRFCLYLHGDGHACQQLTEFAKGEPNICFTGRYTYADINKLYEQSDVIWAAYPNKDFNVRYAISNKFHESLIFGIPTIYSINTEVGNYASSNSIGMQVDPYSVESIKEILADIASGTIDLSNLHTNMLKFQESQTTWNEDFMQVIRAIDCFSKTVSE